VPLAQGAPLLVVTPPSGQPQTAKSPFPCQILNRSARESDSVKKGDPLLLLEDLTKPLLARLYVPVSTGYTVEANMPVQVSPANVNSSEFGFLKGQVVSAARFPITQQELAARLQNQDLAQQLATGGPKLQILVALVADPKAPSGYQWSASTGPSLQLYSGTPCQGRIIVAQRRPIQLVFPSLGK
jgi:HlyD family secretion protein